MRTSRFLAAASLAVFLASCMNTTKATPQTGSSSSSSSSIAMDHASSASSSIQAMQAQPAGMMKRASSAATQSSKGTAVAKGQKNSAASSSSAHELTDAEWRAKLTADQYAVLRQGGTETPFTSPLVDEHRKGTFYSVDCNEPVFRSEQKFDSGTGWPSFWAPIKGAVTERVDTSAGMSRTEVLSKCGGHLGHVFNDGPQPTGLRYCINGLALKFVPDANQ